MVEEFTELTGQKLKLFIQKKSKEIGINLNPDALDFLVSIFKSNTWALMTELQKIRWLAPLDPAGPGLEAGDEKSASSEPSKKTIFLDGDLTGLAPETKTASPDLAKLREVVNYSLDDNSFPLINALGYEGDLGQRLITLERLFQMREEPVKIFNILASRTYLSFEDLQKMADYDIMVKSGKMEYEEVLLDLILL